MVLIKLMYTSKMADDFNWSDMPDLVEKAQTNNARLEITGVLASYNREILQVLEGEALAVTTLFGQILQDPRHKNIKTLNVEQIQRREFVNWKMKEVSIERIAEGNKGWLRQFLNTADGETYYMPEKYDAMYALLRAVYKSASDDAV